MAKSYGGQRTTNELREMGEIASSDDPEVQQLRAVIEPFTALGATRELQADEKSVLANFERRRLLTTIPIKEKIPTMIMYPIVLVFCFFA